MRKQVVSVGMRHGFLTVLKEVEPDKRSVRRYECLCDCGATAVLRSNHFYQTRRYCTRKCPLLSAQRVLDLTGKKFTKWTVQAQEEIDPVTGWQRWLCKCDCGTVRSVAGASLNSGQSRSCGCLLKEMKATGRTPEEEKAIRRLRSCLSNRKNPARVKAAKIKYETKRDHATPKWLTKEHWAEMNAMYELARRLTKEMGILHAVDHIIPINGDGVSGLHVPWNLQVMTQAANAAKSNRYAGLSGD